jgi:hypothetical protein
MRGAFPDLEEVGSKPGGSYRHVSDEQSHGENKRDNR